MVRSQVWLIVRVYSTATRSGPLAASTRAF
jgi:hypothetical protein